MASLNASEQMYCLRGGSNLYEAAVINCPKNLFIVGGLKPGTDVQILDSQVLSVTLSTWARFMINKMQRTDFDHHLFRVFGANSPTATIPLLCFNKSAGAALQTTCRAHDCRRLGFAR